LSELYDRFYAIVRTVPKGKVVTYGQVAKLAGFPRLARQVGYAMAALPEGSKVPWQRVINAQGRCSQADRGDRLEQIAILKQEGVTANAEGVIDLNRYRWVPE